MTPADGGNENCDSGGWSHGGNGAPEGFAFPVIRANGERSRYETAELTPLGGRLLGLDFWG